MRGVLSLVILLLLVVTWCEARRHDRVNSGRRRHHRRLGEDEDTSREDRRDRWELGPEYTRDDGRDTPRRRRQQRMQEFRPRVADGHRGHGRRRANSETRHRHTSGSWLSGIGESLRDWDMNWDMDWNMDMDMDWLTPHLQGRLQIGPSIDFSWDWSDLIGNDDRNTKWWEGPNVEVITEEEEEDVRTDGGVEISQHFVSSTTNCRDTQTTYKCVATVIAQGKKRFFTTTYQCKYGYARIPGQAGCTQAIHMTNLSQTAESLNLTKLLEAVDSVGISRILQTGNYTIFGPSDKAFEDFERKQAATPSFAMMRPNVVAFRIDGRPTAVVTRMKDTLGAHLLQGFRTSSSFADEELLDTANPSNRIRINIYDVPEKMVTANCAKVTKVDQLTTNGVIHVIDKVLEPVTKSIMEVIRDDPNLSTLLTAITNAGLGSTFESDGQLTLFAPSNAAFQKLNQGTLRGLLNNTKCLTKLLQQHVLGNVICSAIIQGHVKSKNLLDNYLSLKEENGTFSIEDAHLTTRDVMTTNGVIHIIDAVLVPSEARDVLTVAGEAGVSTALSLLEQSGLSDKLRASEGISLFLPSDDAFQDLSLDLFNQLNSTPALLANVLTYHVVSAEVKARQLRDGQELSTLNAGKNIRTKVYTSFPFSHQQTKVVQCAKIEKADIESCNGIVHIIDKVILPPSGDLVAILEGDGRFVTLLSLLRRTGLDRTLQGIGPFTVFAPTEEAFSQVSVETYRRLEEEPQLLVNLLQHHIIYDTFCCAGAFPPSFFFTPRERTLDGSDVRITRRNDDVEIDGVAVTTCDLAASNGVIQVIDQLLPSAVSKYLETREPSRFPWRINRRFRDLIPV